ncbi:MAG: hypothetical protein ACYCW6_00440, partial [Candidatus Xenobia bacterium]
MSLPAISPESKGLEQTYRSLAPEARKVVQIMSVFYHSMPLQGDLSSAMGFLSATGRTPQQMFEYLRDLGMLEHKGSAGWECQPLIKELATRDLLLNGDFERIAKPVQAICKVPPPPRLPEMRSYWQLMRELRLALYRSDWDRMQTLMGRARTFAEFEANHPFTLICTRPFDPEWFGALPQRLREAMVDEILKHETRRLSRVDDLLDWIRPQARIVGGYFFHTVNDLCLQGRWDEAQEILKGNDIWYALQMQAWISFARGDMDGAREFFRRAFKNQKSNKMDRFLDVIPEQIYLASCLQAQDSDGPAYIQEVVKTTGGSPRYARWETAWRSQSPDAKVRAPVPDGKELWYDALVTGVVGALMDPAAARAGLPVYRQWMQVAQQNGFHWVAGEFQAILSRLDASVSAPEGPHLVGLARPKPRWERALVQLTSLGEEAARRRADVRLCWHLKLSGTQAIVFPREQRRDQQGEWGKGRPMAIKRLWDQQTADFLTDQDRAVVATIQQVKSAHGSMEHELDMPRAIRSLVGHPLLFLEDTDDTIDLVHGRPVLEVREDGEELVVTLAPAGEGEWAVVPDGPSRYRLVTFTPDQLAAAAILGK